MTTVYDADGSRAVQQCLACGSRELAAVLDLGRQPLANSFLCDGHARSEPTFPLAIQMCRECLLVQLTHIVDPALMFSSYLYVPSTSSTWRQHAEDIAEYVCAHGHLRAGDLVVEIGSNDGTLLRVFQRHGLQVLGVDPAENIAKEANASGVPTLNRFFDDSTACEILAEHGHARAVVSTNVLAHVPDPVGVLKGVRRLLAPDSVYVNESPSLREMVLDCEFDTIYHEHVFYYSLHALDRLFRLADLGIVDAVPQAVHGGSLRVLAAPVASARSRNGDRLEALRTEEQTAGVLQAEGLQTFAGRAQLVRQTLLALAGDLRSQGKRLAAYGATAKGNTLLGFCGLTHSEIEYIADRNPMKQGRRAPGSRIPIVSVEHLEADPPDVLLLLAWNLAKEIQAQLAWFRERGGRFLIPVPDPHLV